jgi:replicative DNA helicase
MPPPNEAPERLPPQNPEAERSVLGSMLRDNAVIGDVVQIVRTEHFYADAHQKIFSAITHLYDRGKPVDIVVLAEELHQRGHIEDIGGYAYLTELWDAAPTAANAVYYSNIVRDRSLVRSLIHTSTEILRDAYDQVQPADEMLQEAERKMFEIASSGIVGQTYELREAIDDAFERIDRQALGEATHTGLPTGYLDVDEITAGLHNSELVIVAARPSVGKCLASDSEIVLANGSIATIADVHHRRLARLLTLHDDQRFRLTEPSAYVDDGVKRVYRVTTHLGRRVEATAAHPFLTVCGWRPVAQLRPGERIAVPRRIGVFGAKAQPDCVIKLLAYLIGNGRWTGAAPEFDNDCPLLRAEFAEAATECSVARQHLVGSRLMAVHSAAWSPGAAAEAVDVTVPSRGGRNESLTTWLQELGVSEEGERDRCVPHVIFRLPRPQLALFLNRLFATGGWASVLTTGKPRLCYRAAGERLTRHVQHLLLRFGILAALRRCGPEWQLEITERASIRTFLNEIGIFGKEAALAWISAALSRHGNREVIPAALRQRLTRSSEPDADTDVYWDEIVAIEDAGRKQVYDLTIPGTHNFVANDICVHNTAFALNVIRNVVVEERQPAFFVSLEQARIELAERLLVCQARVDSHKLRKGRLNSDDIDKLVEAGGLLKNAKLFIDDTPSQNMLRIAANARRLKLREKIKIVVVDYLQLIEPDNRRDPRHEQVAQISRRLKFLARELNIPVVALAQVNRSSEDRHDHKPRLADLRESGSLEADADTVILLHRPDVYEPGEREGVVEAIVAKQRNGPTGEVTLTYVKQFMRFENHMPGTPFEG